MPVGGSRFAVAIEYPSHPAPAAARSPATPHARPFLTRRPRHRRRCSASFCPSLSRRRSFRDKRPSDVPSALAITFSLTVSSRGRSLQEPGDPLPGQGCGPAPLPVGAAHDQTAPVDDDRVGMADDPVAGRDLPILVGGQGNREPGPGVEAPPRLGALVDEDPQDGQPPGTELSPDLLLGGKLPPAVRSPGGPEAQQNDLSPEIAEPVNPAGGIREHEVGSLPALLGRENLQRPEIVLSRLHLAVGSHEPRADNEADYRPPKRSRVPHWALTRRWARRFLAQQASVFSVHCGRSSP